jgi:hypothetical protein
VKQGTYHYSHCNPTGRQALRRIHSSGTMVPNVPSSASITHYGVLSNERIHMSFHFLSLCCTNRTTRRLASHCFRPFRERCAIHSPRPSPALVSDWEGFHRANSARNLLPSAFFSLFYQHSCRGRISLPDPRSLRLEGSRAQWRAMGLEDPWGRSGFRRVRAWATSTFAFVDVIQRRSWCSQGDTRGCIKSGCG